MDPKENRAFKLRRKTVEELLKSLSEHRKELASLRVNKVSSGVASKLAKVKVVRKTIARILTLVNQKRRAELKEAFSTKAGVKKYNETHGTNFSVNRLPKKMRNRMTRNLRRKITKEQANRLLPKQLKKRNAFPKRTYALSA